MGKKLHQDQWTRREAMRLMAAGVGASALTGLSGLSGCARIADWHEARHNAAPGDFPRARFVETNGIRMAYYERGEGLPVLMLHGFPELAYSWRYQIRALADAGYRAIAPDQRGYGLTDRPAAVEDYDINHLTGDLVGLLDALEIEKVIICGHDWGGFISWQFPLLYPERVAGAIGVNTPFLARPPVPPVQMIKALRGEKNYIVAFQELDKPEAALEKNVRDVFTFFLRKNVITAEEFAKLPAEQRTLDIYAALEAGNPGGELLVSEAELDYYVRTFERTGFRGGVNWYRNMDRNWELSEGLSQKIDVPGLQIGAEDDVFLPPSMARGMERYVPDLETHVIADCGHWTQQEKPDELNRLMIDWLDRRFGA